MSRVFLLGGMLAILAAAGATTLAFKINRPAVAQQRAPTAEPIDPAILSKHLQSLPEEMTLP
jgi:hypothetical protein